VSRSAAQPSRSAEAAARSPLEQLLHALNQPLTGLQCSLEVALASERTVEYYRQRLREGLELTERMRTLVEAIREVTDAKTENEGKYNEDKNNEQPETIELTTLLQEVVDELEPVARMKGVRIHVEGPAAPMAVRVGRRRLSTLMFRMLEAAVSLADWGSGVRVETGGSEVTEEECWLRIRWYAGARSPEFSQPELGLLVVQDGWERMGAKWGRERAENLETVAVRLPGLAM
jgi:signal transduction histidine kinase